MHSENEERIRIGNGWSTQRSGVCWWLHSAVTIVMSLHNTTLYNNAIMHTDMTPHIAPLALIMSTPSISLGDTNEMWRCRWWLAAGLCCYHCYHITRDLWSWSGISLSCPAHGGLHQRRLITSSLRSLFDGIQRKLDIYIRAP